MRTVYLDSNFICHVTNDGAMTAVTTDFFDGKCDNFVEGYRMIPEGQTWTRPDGIVFKGEAVFPWKDYTILAAYQSQYESDKDELEDMKTALGMLEVTVDG